MPQHSIVRLKKKQRDARRLAKWRAKREQALGQAPPAPAQAEKPQTAG